jgi:hypothetical protein
MKAMVGYIVTAAAGALVLWMSVMLVANVVLWLYVGIVKALEVLR